MSKKQWAIFWWGTNLAVLCASLAVRVLSPNFNCLQSLKEGLSFHRKWNLPLSDDELEQEIDSLQTCYDMPGWFAGILESSKLLWISTTQSVFCSNVQSETRRKIGFMIAAWKELFLLFAGWNLTPCQFTPLGFIYLTNQCHLSEFYVIKMICGKTSLNRRVIFVQVTDCCLHAVCFCSFSSYSEFDRCKKASSENQYVSVLHWALKGKSSLARLSSYRVVIFNLVLCGFNNFLQSCCWCNFSNRWIQPLNWCKPLFTTSTIFFHFTADVLDTSSQQESG